MIEKISASRMKCTKCTYSERKVSFLRIEGAFGVANVFTYQFDFFHMEITGEDLYNKASGKAL
ncbi:MAG: hypothetical protein D3904_07140 [Candidatus Electrothrix sp. EH2]|nr:hypothetical protein [Candidatus Electrothrix sp. EH2]